MQALADSPLIIPPNLIADNTDSKEKEKDLQPSASGSGINALKSIRTLRSFHADNKSHLLVRSLDTLKDTKLKTLVYLFASFLAPFIVVFDRTDDASQHTLLLAHQQLKDFIQQNASNLDNVSRCSWLEVLVVWSFVLYCALPQISADAIKVALDKLVAGSLAILNMSTMASIQVLINCILCMALMFSQLLNPMFSRRLN
jgi:hypothetical protein